jgi:hypothetical protein
MAKEIK